jgi:Methyltransferase domain
MQRLDLQIEPFANEPARWGASLVNDAEIVVDCLVAARATSVVEVGAYAGDLTSVLLQWSKATGGTVRAVDPAPQKELVALAADRDDLELIRATSHEALATMEPADAIIIDGDHNWFTVTEELRLVAERAGDDPLPLLLFHDVCWPHAHRDDYFDPQAIPESARHPTHEGGKLFPGDPGVHAGGLPYRFPAAREGGPRNGVLTAVEDFVAEHDHLRFAVVPAFFGFGAVWDPSAPWADDLAALLEPYDRHPVLERLESNRVLHLAASQHMYQRAARQEVVLRRLLDSKAFAVAEWISRLRHRVGIATEASVISKEEIRRTLRDAEG